MGTIFTKMLILLAFVSVAVFGFLAMDGHNGSIHGCIASAVGKAPCPQEDPVGYASFHLNFFKIFSSALDNGFALSVLMLFAMVLLAFAPFGFGVFPQLATRFAYFQLASGPPNSFHLNLINWLAFHENSPSFLVGSVT